MKTILIVLSIFTMTACSSAQKQKMYTEQEAKQIYQAGIEASKPKQVSLINGTANDPGKTNISFNFVSYFDPSTNGGFLLTNKCVPLLVGPFNEKLDAYDFYKSVGQAMCRGTANFKGLEMENEKSKKIVPPKPTVAKKVPTTLNKKDTVVTK